MLNAIVERIKFGLTVWELRRLPAVGMGRELISRLWTNNREVVKDFSPKLVERQGEAMMEEVIKISVSPDPRMANRARLAEYVCELAQFQVLVIPPPPAEDETGLRGQPGITGELKPRLFDLYHSKKSLQEFFHEFSVTPQNWDDVWNAVLPRYRQLHAYASVLQGLRYVFDDIAAKDWFGPFLAAMCGWEESLYRDAIGMESAFGNPSCLRPSLQPLLLSSFVNCVTDGAQYPDLEWKKRVAEIEHGDAWRANSWLI